MALYNEILAGRYNRLFQKLFGLKGKTGAPQLAGELMPVIPIFAGIENRYLEQWQRFAAAPVVSGVAAQNSAIQIANPAGSNVIGVIEKFFFLDLVAADQPRLALITTNIPNLGTLFTAARLDARQAAAANNNLTVSVANNAGVTGVPIYQTQVAAAPQPFEVIFFEDQELTLLPGDSLRLTTGANVGIFVVIFWRERFLEDSERA